MAIGRDRQNIVTNIRIPSAKEIRSRSFSAELYCFRPVKIVPKNQNKFNKTNKSTRNGNKNIYCSTWFDYPISQRIPRTYDKCISALTPPLPYINSMYDNDRKADKINVYNFKTCRNGWRSRMPCCVRTFFLCLFFLNICRRESAASTFKPGTIRFDFQFVCRFDNGKHILWYNSNREITRQFCCQVQTIRVPKMKSFLGHRTCLIASYAFESYKETSDVREAIPAETCTSCTLVTVFSNVFKFSTVND